MPHQSLHSTALGSKRPRADGGLPRRLLHIALCCGGTIGLMLAVTSARLLAQQPYPYYPVYPLNRPAAAPAAAPRLHRNIPIKRFRSGSPWTTLPPR